MQKQKVAKLRAMVIFKFGITKNKQRSTERIFDYFYSVQGGDGFEYFKNEKFG